MKKMCAICGDITTLNVRNVFERAVDKKKFNVCMACRERGIDAKDLKEMTCKGYSTINTENNTNTTTMGNVFVGMHPRTRR